MNHQSIKKCLITITLLCVPLGIRGSNTYISGSALSTLDTVTAFLTPAENATIAATAGLVVPNVAGLGVTSNSGVGVAVTIAPYMIVGGALKLTPTSHATKNDLTWRSYFPMAYNLDLTNTHATSAGLTLANDLKFVGNGNFSKLGNITGAGYNIELSPRASFFPLPTGSTVVNAGSSAIAASNAATLAVIQADSTDVSPSTVSCGWYPDYKSLSEN